MTTAGSLENQELMSQGKNLSVQRCAGPKSLPNLRKKRENDREHGISNRSKNAQATPIAVDQRAPNGGDDHGWIAGEPRADVAGQESQRAALRGSEILAESKKRASK